jgi:MFS family permease
VSTDATRAGYRSHQVTMMGLAAVAFFASAPGQSFLVSVFVDDLLVGTGLSRTTFSALYAAGTIVSAGSMLALGRVVDRRGLRTAWLVVTVALALACGLASLATGAVVAFLALAALRTFGQGSFPLVGTLLVARSFRARRGQAMAVANLGLTGASIVLPPVAALLILEVGWRHAYQVLGLSLLVLVLPLALLVRPAPEGPEQAERNRPAPEGTPAQPAASRKFAATRFSIPTRSAGLMLFVLAAPPLVGTALIFHAVSILAERGLTFLQAGFALSVLGISSAVGTVGTGLVVDRLPTRMLLIVLSCLVLLAPSLLLVPGSALAVIAFGVLGVGMGTTGVANGTVWARTYGLARLGRIQGTAQSSMITAAAVAPLLPAVSGGVTGSYTPGLVALAGLAALACLAALRWREPSAVEARQAPAH